MARLQANIELGWSPILAVASTGTSRVLEVVGWEGGFGSAPSTGLFVGSNGYVANITDGVNIAGGGGGGGNINISAGASSSLVSAVTFSNANGISFGYDGTNVTATVATNYQSQGAYLTTAMQSNAATISNINMSAGTTSTNASAFTFSNANNVTFGLGTGANVGVITASIPNFLTTAAQSNQVVNSVNGSTGQISLNVGSSLSSSTNGSSITFGLASNITTALQSTGAYLTTAMQSNAATISNIKVSASNTSLLLSALTFANSNNFTFGLSNNSVITASYTVPTVTNSSLTIAAGGSTLSSVSQLVFVNSNGVSFGASTSNNGSITITATVQTNYLTTAMQSNAATISNIKISAGASSSLVSAVTFSNANGVSFGYDGTNVTASVAAAGGAQTGISGIIAGTQTQTSGTVSFANSNGVTFGMSNSSVITASIATSLTNINFSAGTTSANLSAITFSNSNGISFGFNSANSVVTATVQTNYLTTARASSDAIGLNTAQTNVTWTVNSSGLSLNAAGYAGTGTSVTNASITLNSNGLAISVAAPGGGGAVNFSAGTTSANLQSVVFANGNGVTFGLNTGASSQSITASVASQSNQTLGLYATGNTTQNTSATFDARTVSFNAAGGISWGYTNGSVQVSAPPVSSLSGTGGISISTNGSTISIGAPLAASLSRFNYPDGHFGALGQTGNGSLSVNHMYIPFYVTATAAKIGMSISAATNTSATTASANNSVWMGIYTLNGSTLSLASSGSQTFNFAWSQSASTTGNTSINSMRQMTVPINMSVTPGEYWMAAVISQATTYTSVSMAMYGNSNIANAASNVEFAPIGSNTSVRNNVFQFQGIYTAGTSAGPASINTVDINYTSQSNVQRANFYVQLFNATY
jgi:hypothetical protein